MLQKSILVILSLAISPVLFSAPHALAATVSVSGANALLQVTPPLVLEVGKKHKGKGKKHKGKGKHWDKYGGKYKGGNHVRHWSRKPHYGDFFAGVALGTILGVATAGIAPPPPSSELCWYWTDPSRTRGYWDYCY